MLAIDQRPPIFNIIENTKGGKASYKDIAEFKGLLTQFLSPYSSAILMDPIYSFPNLMPLNKSKGLVMTLEDHNFVDSTKGRLSKKINNWSVEKIKKSGGDAVKVLLWYRPDASKLIINKQKKFLMEIGNDCKKFDIPLLLELLVYPFKKDDNYNTNYSSWQNKKHDQVINSIKEFSKLKYNVSGPFAADTIFLKKNRNKYDVIVGMYHDQVLTPIKTLFEYDAINILSLIHI